MRTEDMLTDYLEEARNICQALDSASYRLSREPSALKEVMRLFHTLKGSSGFMGFDTITELCHLAEDRVSAMDKPPEGFAQFLRSLAGTLEEVMGEIESTGAELPSCREKLRPFVEALSAEDYSVFLEAAGFEGSPGIRITPEKLDRILAFLGEAEATKNRLSRERSRLPRDLARAFHELELSMDALRDEIMGLRMVDMGRYLRRLGILVQEMADQLGKRVEMVALGSEIQVDKAVADGVMDAMVHLIRNALDHGIEPPQERERLGKPPAGRITIEITQEGNRVRIAVSDDGAGVDMEKLRAKAEEIYGKMELDEKALLSLLFTHGFTTKDKAGELSGRGVGLDVVKESAERMGGNVLMETARDKGTSVTLDLPLTLLVTPLAFLRIGNETFAIPLSSLVRVDWREDVEMVKVGERSFVKRPGGALPLVDGGKVLGGGEGGDMVITLRGGGGEFGLLVDEVLPEGSGVIRPLGSVGGKAFIGAIIGPDGTPILVLDPAFLSERAGGIV